MWLCARRNGWSLTDGKEGKPYRGLGNNIEFSDDEKHVLYRADTPEGQMIVVDGVGPNRVPSSRKTHTVSVRNGQRVAYIGRESRDAQFVVVTNKNGKTYEDVGKPAFSPDSKHVFYEAWRAGKMIVVTDGSGGEAFGRS
jgi:hypothetical protein